ncbi:uncharacterized protein LOC115629984 [Scaptodrosophila lebanonensis]|uniref:Uncharacterized protein LOC115629984 n=1 Tax=Drosophila lebanonensis TaxID=7225 RepID=A0A6J2U5P3_DROLE|nr:uncharacterized protein LOC115629984 [Scaptodrosophila lebanonensis]
MMLFLQLCEYWGIFLLEDFVWCFLLQRPYFCACSSSVWDFSSCADDFLTLDLCLDVNSDKSISTTPKPKRSPKGSALVTSNVLLRPAKGSPNSSSPKEATGKNEPANSTPKTSFRPIVNTTTVVRRSGEFHAPVQPYNPTVAEAANSGSSTASLYKRATASHTSPKTRRIRSSAAVRSTSASARAAQHDHLRPDVQDLSRSDLIELDSNEEEIDSDSLCMEGASALPVSPPNQQNTAQNVVAEPVPLQSDDLETQGSK